MQFAYDMLDRVTAEGTYTASGSLYRSSSRPTTACP